MLIIINSYLSRHAISSWGTSFAGTRVKRKRTQPKTLPTQANFRDFLVVNFNSAELRLLQTNMDDSGSLKLKNAASEKPLADLFKRLFSFRLWEAYGNDLRAIPDRDILEVIWQANNARQLGRRQTARELACWLGVYFALHSGIAADAEAREIEAAAPLPTAQRASAQRL